MYFSKASRCSSWLISEIPVDEDCWSIQFSLIVSLGGKGPCGMREYCCQGCAGMVLSPPPGCDKSTLERRGCVGRFSLQPVEASLLLNERGLLCFDVHDRTAKSSTDGRPPTEGGADSGRFCVRGREGEDGALYAPLPGTHCAPVGTPWSESAVLIPPEACWGVGVMSSTKVDEFHTPLFPCTSLSMMEDNSCLLLLLLLLVLSELFQACLSGEPSSHTTDSDVTWEAGGGGCDVTGPQMPDDRGLKVPESPRRSDARIVTAEESAADFWADEENFSFTGDMNCCSPW